MYSNLFRILFYCTCLRFQQLSTNSQRHKTRPSQPTQYSIKPGTDDPAASETKHNYIKLICFLCLNCCHVTYSTLMLGNLPIQLLNSQSSSCCVVCLRSYFHSTLITAFLKVKNWIVAKGFIHI